MKFSLEDYEEEQEEDLRASYNTVVLLKGAKYKVVEGNDEEEEINISLYPTELTFEAYPHATVFYKDCGEEYDNFKIENKQLNGKPITFIFRFQNL